MMYTMGFIGAGNMGSALAKAASKGMDPKQLVLADFFPEKAQALAAQLGCEAGNNELIASSCAYIMLAVKPQMMGDMLASIAPVLKARKEPFVLVTMAAGMAIAKIQVLAGGNYPVIRIMPNTPCGIGSGMVLCCKNELVSEQDYQQFKQIMAAAGTLLDIREGLIDAGCAISGCGPAFVYTFIEAMADAGVACGLSRADAKLLAAATVQGSAKMVMEAGEHPAQLRDNVCSPGGSTIAGVLQMENDGFRAAVANGVLAAYEKTVALGK